MEIKKRKNKPASAGLRRGKEKTIKKSSVLRYRTPKKPKLFDESVPKSLLNVSTILLNKPAVKFSKQAELSPFVLYFNPEKTEAVEENQSVQLDFAVPEHEFKIASQSIDDLNFSREDLSQQFLENENTPKPINLSFPTTKPFFLSAGSLRQALQNFKNRIEINEPSVEPFNLEELQPAVQKETVAFNFQNLLTLDLPEDENEDEPACARGELRRGEEDETNLLTWEDVVRSSVEPIETVEVIETKINWTENFSQKISGFKKYFSSLSDLKIPLRLGSLEMSAGWHRALVAFVLVSFIFVLPLHAMESIHGLQGAKENLLANGTSAVSKLNEAVSLITTNSASAATSFEAAGKDFDQAQTTIDNLNSTSSLLLSIIPSTRASFVSGKNLVAAGQELSEAGERVSQGLSTIQEADGLDTTGKLKILTETFDSVLPTLEKADEHLKNVDPTTLPEEYQARLKEIQTLLPNFISSAKNITSFSDTLSTLLGADGKKRYLLLFQNNTELRPTGGFIGSFAVIDISHGEITNLEVPEGGSYDLQGSLKENLVAPLPLQLISARWEFQDANWFPDFPTSARQTLEFYNSAGWPTVDGVVAVNATFIASLLDFFGPVEMSSYDRTIDSENFLFETQKIVEYDYAAYNTAQTDREEPAPKAFIGDLATNLLSKIKDLDTASLLKILDSTQKGFSQKDIQVYFPNNDLQKTAIKLGWAGEIKQTDRDFLMLTNANLGGGKTDLVIDEKLDLNVSVQNDGRIINTLTITRTHNGINGAIFTGVNNVDFMRVYVPKGSKLISASGFTIPDISLFEEPDGDWVQDSDVLFYEKNASVDPNSGTIISEEAGKTVFGNWSQTRPGETSTIIFSYELPFTIKTKTGLIQAVKNKVGLNDNNTYSLLIQKQSGALNRTTGVTISSDLKTVWSSAEKEKMVFDNTTDSFLSVLFSN